jgi:tryptophan synthase beta chain
MFYPFLGDVAAVKLIGVEAAGYGLETGKHSAALAMGTPGVLHGSMQYLLQDDQGQVQLAHSISAGLDYPGVGPEHAWLKDTGRASYVSITDEEALEGFKVLTLEEGILPALESSHAIAHVLKLAPTLSNEETIVVCLSGRGDKDIHTVAEVMGVKLQ